MLSVLGFERMLLVYSVSMVVAAGLEVVVGRLVM